MKKCKSCGTLQKDERTTCIDCGERLGKPLSGSELEAAEEVFQDQLEDMSERTDDFRVTKVSIVLIALHILATVALIVLRFIARFSEDWGGAYVSAILGNILIAVDLAFPRLTWSMHKAMLEWRYSNVGDVEPGPLWKYSGKVISVLVLGLSFYIICKMLSYV